MLMTCHVLFIKGIVHDCYSAIQRCCDMCRLAVLQTIHSVVPANTALDSGMNASSCAHKKYDKRYDT